MITTAARAALGAVLVLAVAGCTAVGQSPASGPPAAAPAPPPSPSPSPEPRYRATEGLAVGDCFDPIHDHVDQGLLAGRMLDCDAPHLMELFAKQRYELPDGAPYPGESKLDREAEKECRDAFQDYVGIDYDASRLSATYYTPSPDSWRYGDREILCVVEATEVAPLTRSVKGSGA